MPTSKPSTARLAAIGGLSITAVAAFFLGRMSGDDEASGASRGGGNPTHRATGTDAAGSGENGNTEAGTLSQHGSTFAAGAEVEGEQLTLEQVTAGQPLEDWLKKIMAQDDPRFRVQSLLRLIGALRTPGELETALNAMVAVRSNDRGPGGGRMTEYSMLMARMVHLDPKAALAYASKQEGGEKSTATVTAMRTWTQADPQAALAWAMEEGAKVDYAQPNRDDGRVRTKDNVALVAVLEQLARTDLDQALKVASTKIGLSPTLVLTGTSTYTSTGVPIANFEIGASFKLNQPNDKYLGNTVVSTGTLQISSMPTVEMGRMSERAVSVLATEMVNQRGTDEAKAALESMDNGLFKDTYTRQLANRLAQEDAVSATAWAAALPGGEAKSGALATAVNQWARSDVTAAGNFLAQLPVSSETDRARERYADRVSDQDPEGALAWAETISNKGQREKAIANLIEDWNEKDPEAATRWVTEDVRRRTLPR